MDFDGKCQEDTQNTDSHNTINTFAAKRDCSRIYRSLPNVTTVEIKGTVDSSLFLTVLRDANLSSLF